MKPSRTTLCWQLVPIVYQLASVAWDLWHGDMLAAFLDFGSVLCLGAVAAGDWFGWWKNSNDGNPPVFNRHNMKW